MEGRIFSYVHFNGQMGSLVQISTITDFAARTDEFLAFGKNIALQIASTQPVDKATLMSSQFVKDPEKTVEGLVNDMSKTLGEEVKIVAYEFFGFER